MSSINLQKEKEEQKSVIIIGAGLAGLTAAEEILKANPKAKVTVLEAMAEPGGRTRSVEINGTVYDLGAQWVGHPQKYTLELAERAQNVSQPQFYKGTKILQLGQDTQMYTGDNLQIGYLQLIHLQLVMWKVDRLAKTVPFDNPRDCPNAIEWDSMTFHSWVEQNVWFDKVRRLFECLVRIIVGCDTNEISFLFLLWYVRQNHGLDCLLQIENGLQARKFTKGTQYLSKFLAQSIEGLGGQVLCNRFVCKVTQNETEVTVKTRDGEEFKAQYMIFAGPPPAARSIEFQPQLSRERRLINSRYIMGGYSKMVLLYDKPYWREKNFSGQILSDCHDSPVLETYDDTRVKENGEEQAAIVVFFAASIDEQWTGNEDECKKQVSERLASYFKCPEMIRPTAIEMKVWNEEESVGGAPTGYTPPGVLTKISSMRHVEGLIHWAGTETASISQGYMDGAIESGIRVSKEILGRFNNEFTPIPREKPSSKWYSMISGYKRPGFLEKLRLW